MSETALAVSSTTTSAAIYQKVLYGGQTQGALQMHLVIRLAIKILGDVLNEEECREKIKQFLSNSSEALKKGLNKCLTTFLVGVRGARSMSAGNYTVTSEEVGDKGKVKFDIVSMLHPKSDESKMADTSAEVQAESYVPDAQADIVAPKMKDSPRVERVNRLKAEMLPHVPDDIKKKYADNEYAQCLAIAKKYFNVK